MTDPVLERRRAPGNAERGTKPNAEPEPARGLSRPGAAGASDG